MSGFFPAALHAAPIMPPLPAADDDGHMAVLVLNVNEGGGTQTKRDAPRKLIEPGDLEIGGRSLGK